MAPHEQKALLALGSVCVAFIGGAILGNAIPDEGPHSPAKAYLGTFIAIAATGLALASVLTP